MNRYAGCLAALIAIAFSLLWTGSAAAQANSEVTCSLSKSHVDVGDVFTVNLKAMVENGPMPQNPRLNLPDAFSASGPQISTRTMAQLGGGSSLIQRGIGASWRVRALRDGAFTIAPPTVSIGGRTVTASGHLRITVGSGSSPDPNDPNADDFLDDDLSAQGRKLALDKAPDRYAFVRIVPDKTNVVVGEQVTLSYYFYRYQRYTQIGPPREPPLTDFLRFPLDRAPGVGGSVTTRAGERVYEARLIDRVAVFPVRAGKLNTGRLKLSFTGRSFGNLLQTRESNDLEITVREPPKKDRPVGYRVGDTGRFDISASVKPRRARVGDSVAVEVTLSGVGSLPGSLKLPERIGVEWLAPEKHENISVENGKIAGFRTFRYAVRLNRAGDIDLGSVELPHWDPQARQYRDATAVLGAIAVAPKSSSKNDGSGGGAAATADDDDAFAEIGAPRTAMAVYAGGADDGFSPLWLWSLVAAPPLLVLLGGAVWRGAGGLSERLRQRKDDPGYLAKRALGQINAKDDAKDIAASCERAVHWAIEAACGLKSRALLLEELGDKMEQAGAEPALAQDTLALLQDCSTLRFEPAADAGQANALATRARKLVKQLLKSRKSAAAAASDAAA